MANVAQSFSFDNLTMRNQNLIIILITVIVFGLSEILGLAKTQSVALIPLRIGLAIVFLSFGFDNIFHSGTFSQVGNKIIALLLKREVALDLSLGGKIQGIIEIIVALSYLSGLYLGPSAIIGSIIVALILVAYLIGFRSLLVRDIGILGGTLSLWLIANSL